MTFDNCKLPYCFGKIENVFPLGKDKLRVVSESCMLCFCKTNCLKTAVEGEEGADIKNELNDRAYFSGYLNFFQRWSRRKLLKKK